MANGKRGEVEIELGGDTLILVYDFNAIAEIEERFGDKPINELILSPRGSVSMRAVREALRVGLDRRNRKRTSNEVGKLIDVEIEKDAEALPRIIKAIVDGLAGAFGRKAEADEPAPKDAEESRPTAGQAVGATSETGGS